ncbi:Ribosome bioproteinsis protein tsr1 [Sphaceloma murrayae]|uniref:Ribosome bioproteinsis protein tsr1 n=1 Tax=Sphaceloma murrayae TaxID=2082308 RepID=A0A2K1QP15_9PEZI|nr:Ribosome bioproteinsis protein tsr1 [Sphaceloma murrayae]
MAAEHHHRSTTKVSHKPFKSKHLSKGAIKEKQKGKVDGFERGNRKTPHQQVMSKLDRRNQAKQKRVKHGAELARATSLFSGKDGAARHVVVVPLCESASAADAVKRLTTSVGIEDAMPSSESFKVEVNRFKQRINFLIPPTRDPWAVLDLCRAADFTVLLMSAEEEVDPLGENLLRTIECQGVSTVISLVEKLGATGPVKKQHQVQASLKSFITHFFAAQEKVHSLDNTQECANVMRTICTTTPKGIRWREERSWMLVEDLQWDGADAQTFSITGAVRGQGLKADRLLQVGDWGAFQVEKIVTAPTAVKKKSESSSDTNPEPTNAVLDQPTEDADDPADLAPEEAVMEDVPDVAASVARSERKGVLLDDHHYFDEDEDDAPKLPKRMPRGTSKYQAAWYLGDMSDSGSDLEDMEDDDGDVSMNGQPHPADGTEGLDQNMVDPTEGAPSEYPQSEMFLDPSPEDEADQLAAYRQNRKDAEEDLEFPDEIELHPGVQARERLARYRGLKSLRTSAWDTEEDKPHEPTEWPRLLDIANYKAAKNRFVNEAVAGGIAPGTRVTIHMRVGDKKVEELRSLPRPTALFSLLRHEQKRTVMNFSITLDSEYPTPLKAKEPIIMQCGPRRMVINPLFSQQGNTPNNVHKFDRFLHPGQTATASVIAPLTWGSVPVLYFRQLPDTKGIEGLEFIGTGTALAPSTSRVIAKRAILTGHPYKIHKRLVTVRYMFFNREDVEWFRALQLWTKRGRSGFIKEALGTHGYFKATFDGKINPLDAVAVSLYKRVFPRWANAYMPESDATQKQGEVAMEIVEPEGGVPVVETTITPA